MTEIQLGRILVSLAAVVAASHLLGYAFERLRQPRLIGEILAGVLIGPFVLGYFAPGATDLLLGSGGDQGEATRMVLSFIYWLGLLLLMFISGSEVRRVLGSENRRPTAWILGVGTSLPFCIALIVGMFLPLDAIAGPSGERTSVLLIVAIAVAVCSIPVISRIFYDLRILHTRFASLVLGAALLEDIVLWAVLAFATAVAATSAAGADVAENVTAHVAATIGYMAVGLTLAPSVLRRVHGHRWNLIERTSPAGYAILTMLMYAAVATALDVNLVFAAFLAGLGLVGGMGGSQRRRFAEPLDAIQKVSMGVFIPVYFAIVGSQLEFGRGFSIWLLIAFLGASSLLRLGSVGLAARLAGFRGVEVVNLAVACNARGGPGIVLATVAYEAGIIDGAFFTTLVITAVVTSQFAGSWLGSVLRRGWTLLREDAPDLVPAKGDRDDEPEVILSRTRPLTSPASPPEPGARPVPGSLEADGEATDLV
jgi:Kef-type K+ transport system membrane component KefB